MRGLLVLSAIWWAWAAYAWLTNEVDGRRRGVRLAIFGSMIAMLIASLAIPGAFEDDALLFALAYLGVRLMHIALFAAGTGNVDVREAARALAVYLELRSDAGEFRDVTRRIERLSRAQTGG